MPTPPMPPPTRPSGPRLFTPLAWRGVEARNRLWVSPMCQWMATPDGLPTGWHLVNYGGYAIGGAGLVMVESTAVAPEGRISVGDLGLWNDDQAAALAPVAAAIRQAGAVPGIQLGHAGRKASTPGAWDGWGGAYERAEGPAWETVGPSAVANEHLPAPRELTEAEIAGVVEAFTAAARRAVAAGFQVVELHAAHGYLVHQFLSPVANHRTDAWGGDFEGRTRLARTIARRLRHAIGPDAVLAVRLSATDWIDGGWDGEQTVELARRLVSDGVDHLDISTGGIDNPPIKAFPGYQVPFAAQVRAGVGQAAGNGADATGGGAGAVGGGAAAGGRDRPTVSAVGVIVEAGQAEKILADGAADAVMLGRKWLQNPHVASDWAAQLGADLHGVVAAPLSMVRWGR